MSILLDERTPVVIQGFTGDKGTFHAKEMIAYGTNVVGGVTPGKGRTTHLGRPVFNTVKEAVTATGATASLVLVPAPYCADAIMEAADAGIQLVVTITDGVPAQDMMTVKRYLWRYAKERRTRGGGRAAVGEGAHEEAGDRRRRGTDRPKGPPRGARGGHHRGLRRPRGRESGDHALGGVDRAPEPAGARHARRAGGRQEPA